MIYQLPGRQFRFGGLFYSQKYFNMLRIILTICALFVISPIPSFGFNIHDLNDCSGIAIKTLAKSDTLSESNKSKASEIRNIRHLEQIFGLDKRIYTSDFVFLGKSKNIENTGKATWYNFADKSGKYNHYRLYYSKNEVMQAANAGDLLVVCKKDENNISLVVIEKGHKSIPQVYQIAGINEMISPELQPKKSFWQRLFGHTDTQTEKLANVEMSIEMDSPEIPAQKKSRSKKPTEPDMDLNPDSYEKIDFEAERHKTTKRVVLIGTPRIVDGDTIILEELFNIRVIGIDAPESKQTCIDNNGKEYHCGKQSTEHLKKLVGSGRVKCEIRGIGRFGRHTGLCYNMKDVNLNKTMVRDGFAVISTYPPILFQNEETQAIQEKLGIWKGKFQHPHCYRHQKKQDWTVEGLCENNKYYHGWSLFKQSIK